MRCLFFLILFFFSGAVLTSQEDVFEQQSEKHIQKYNIKNRVKWNHAYADGSPKEKGYKNEFVKYDENGHVSEVISYKSNGDMFSMESYKYDQNGYNSGYVRYDAKRDKITYKKAYKYDDEGNKLKEVGFDGASNYKNIYKYNGQGQLQKIIYNVSDQLFQERIFEYKDPRHRILKVYDADGAFQFKMEQAFDKNNNLIENIEYLPGKDSKVKEKLIYEYNDRNQKLFEKKYNGTDLAYHKKYKYNNGLLVEVMKTEPGEDEFAIARYEYDNSGRLKNEYYRKRSSQDFSSKAYSYNEKGLCTAVDCFYASYNYKVLFKYTYEFY
ncbi:MAG: hypothetical protein ACOCUV_02505 [bacterium]